MQATVTTPPDPRISDAQCLAAFHAMANHPLRFCVFGPWFFIANEAMPADFRVLFKSQDEEETRIMLQIFIIRYAMAAAFNIN